jgi:hypothetical protein
MIINFDLFSPADIQGTRILHAIQREHDLTSKDFYIWAEKNIPCRLIWRTTSPSFLSGVEIPDEVYTMLLLKYS